jgi:hypothetical protein
MAPTSRRQRITRSSAPFGHPDGASGDLREVEDQFVDFSTASVAGGLASRPDDRTIRVVVGKKGVGKTIYLRRFQASASDEVSVFAAHRETNPPSTEDVVRVGGMFDNTTVTETWQLIWRRGIQRSAVSQLLCRLRDHVDPEVAGHLASDFRSLMPESRVPRPVYAEVSDILSSAHTPHRLTEALKHRDWVELEYWLGRALREAPPMYLYIDAVDDHFQRAPMYWLKCQKGLFLEIMALLEGELGGRLHVVISIRDLVLSSVLRGEHAGRYRRSPHIRLLEWDYESIRFFLHEKISRLDREFMLRPAQGGVEGWLGRSRMRNEARSVDENVEDYMLRHTRLIPRDVVELGNALCRETAKAKAQGLRELPARTLRRAVGNSARGFAEEQIRVCSNQVSSDQMPAQGGRYGSADFFIGSHEYSDGPAGQFKLLLGELPGDRFDYPALVRFRERGRETMDGYDHLLDVMWHNGVLGYASLEDGATHTDFYSACDADTFHLPPEMPEYVLHPCIPHLVPLRHLGHPVRPRRS